MLISQGQDWPRTKALTLGEFFEHVTAGDTPAPVIVGPRTQGSSDHSWDADARLFTRTFSLDVADAAVDRQTSASPLMVSIASWTDPALRFDSNCDARAHTWFVTDFKRGYQGVRVPGKRPWPEFAASVRSGFGFAEADFAALALVARVNVATVEGTRLIVPPLLLDKDFNTMVLDARSSLPTALGLMCDDALRGTRNADRAAMASKPTHLCDVATAIATEHRGVPKKILASKVASRRAALDKFTRDPASASAESSRADALQYI
jgi:hypothetical protein